MPEAALSTSEDPAFFGLCKETQPEDRRVEMDRFSMLTCDDEDSGGLDETVLYLL